MSFTPKILGSGQLPAITTTLYTCPASTTCVIKVISIVNTDVAVRTINLYLKPSGGTARKIIPNNMSLGIGYMVDTADEVYTLNAGDEVQGDADAANVCEYVLNGIEEA